MSAVLCLPACLCVSPQRPVARPATGTRQYSLGLLHSFVPLGCHSTTPRLSGALYAFPSPWGLLLRESEHYGTVFTPALHGAVGMPNQCQEMYNWGWGSLFVENSEREGVGNQCTRHVPVHSDILAIG